MLQYSIEFDEQDTPSPWEPHGIERRLEALLAVDLDFRGKNSVYGSHAWHAFPAKFPPQLPRLFIENLTNPGDIVLDPMMGSGTTLLEAVSLKRRALGCDIDPLALRMGAVKLLPVVIQEASALGNRLLEEASKRLSLGADEIDSWLERRFDPPSRAFVEYWFHRDTQKELAALMMGIEDMDDSALRYFFDLVFSAIIITKSGGVSLARDLAHTRPHKAKDKTPASALDEFRKRLQRNISNFRFIPEATCQICAANAQHLPLGDNTIDLIVTSPPYASNAIDYMRAHKFSLVWFGYSIDELSSLRKTYIGQDSFRGFRFQPLPPRTEALVEKLTALDSKKGAVLRRYYSEAALFLKEMHRVLKPGHAAAVVVGTSLMRGMDSQTHLCLGDMGQQVGFRLVGTGVRNLDRDKRMMPARRHTHKASLIEERMHKEYVIGLIKPEVPTGC